MRFRPVHRMFARMAARRWLAVAVCGFIALVVSISFSMLRWPLPQVHDEFSYLLAADTFSQGRLTNPTHPCWEHFESFHILLRPTYSSKYPPAQGLFLALGQVLTGAAIVGVRLEVALGAASICWMLQGWMRPRWALFGGLLAALHYGVHGGIDPSTMLYSWSQSYWGGGPAMIGGSLVVGALPRLAAGPRFGTSVGLGIGVVLLANSRPFEGGLLSVASAAWLVGACNRDREVSLGAVVRRVALPVGLVIAPVALAMGEYNRQVTGSRFVMPYSIYETTYNPVPIFALWQETRPVPVYRHATLREFFTSWCLDQWSEQQSFSGWTFYHAHRLRILWTFFVGPLILPFLMIPAVLRRPGAAFSAFVCLLVVAAHLTTVGVQPHYAAPVFACYMLLIVEGVRRLRTQRFGSFRVGRWLVRLTFTTLLIRLGLSAFTWYAASPGWEADRHRIESSLMASGDRHLVIVRYGPGHDFHAEWVYNSADIDASSVVWAREMDASRNERLLAYFQSRRAWLLESDEQPPRLTPYRIGAPFLEAGVDLKSTPSPLPASGD